MKQLKKMDCLISISRNTSELCQDYFPPIQLEPNKSYVLGLCSLSTYNSVNNIRKDICDKIGVHKPDGGLYYVTIPPGAYEIDDLSNVIRGKLEALDVRTFQMKANLSTFKIEIYCEYGLYMPQDEMAKMLGFSIKYFEGKRWHESVLPVNIMPVNIIHVECSIVGGSYRNGQKSHTLYSFYPDVPPGYKLLERPSQIIYLPVTVKEITNICVRLCDQNGDLIDFSGEEISIQLILRELPHGHSV